MAESFADMDLPDGITVDDVLQYIQNNKQRIKQMVDECLAKDKRWIDAQRQLDEMQRKLDQTKNELKEIELENKLYDDMIQELGGCHIE